MSSTGFFGNSSSAVNTTTSGGLFGQKPTSSQTFSTQQPQTTSGLFGTGAGQTQTQSAPGFGASNNNNFSQMQQQSQPTSLFGQQPQQPQQLLATLQPQPIQSSQLNSNKQEAKPVPSWFTDNIKRSTPQAIVKRSSKESNEDQDAFSNSPASTVNKDPFGTVSFGSKKSNTYNTKNLGLSSGSPTALNTEGSVSPNKNKLSFDIDHSDAPPTKSIYDIQREDEFGSAFIENAHKGNVTQTSIDTSLNDTTSRNHSVFKSKNIFEKSNNPSEVNIAKENKADSLVSTAVQGFAVLIFGYPESISNQVIAHFGKFGKVLEDFEVCRTDSSYGIFRLNNTDKSSVNKTQFPIFTGNGWVKITYSSESSASRALKENGTVYGGVLIGCVPYSKEAVEGLVNCKIEKYQDSLSVTVPVQSSNKETPFGSVKLNKENNEDLKKTQINTSKVHSREPLFSNEKKIEVMNGTNIFAHNKTGSLYNNDTDHTLKHGGWYNTLESSLSKDVSSSKQAQGLAAKVNNWLFGWGEL